jgi:hypothetical protein
MTDEMLLLKEVEDYSLKLEETGTVKILFLSRECRTRDVIHLKIAIPKRLALLRPMSINLNVYTRVREFRPRTRPTPECRTSDERRILESRVMV